MTSSQCFVEEEEFSRRNNDPATTSPAQPQGIKMISCELPYEQASGNRDHRYETQTFDHMPTFPLKEMSNILYGPEFNRLERLAVYKLFDQPELLSKRLYSIADKWEARKFVEKQARIVLQCPSMAMYRIRTEPIKIVHRITMTGMLNTSLGTKVGVQAGLFGGSVLNLGSDRHEHYLEPVSKLELAGCFCMTELLHGSNVKGLQTTATYDPETEEFIIHTPNQGAIKWWIGNAALSGQIGTVFARLITGGIDYGVHAFLVPLRDLKTHEVLPGVIIGDCGDKNGLHGVDNGFVAFDHVRIPRVNLLNRFGDVLPDGTYASAIKSEGKRFAALLGELITGRASLSVNTMNIRRIATTVATRFAHRRKQFGPNDITEIPIIDYPSTCVRIMPVIASCYAGEFALRKIMKKYSGLYAEQRTEAKLAETHALISGLKAISTWDTQRCLQTLRECCGGHGYSAYCQFGTLLNDNDIMQTYEGDNTVLIQQLGGYLMREFSKQFQGNIWVDSFNFLKKQMGTIITQRNPIITRLTTKSHLRDEKFYLQAFEYRTAKLLTKCATDFNSCKKKMEPFHAWASVVPIMNKLARAYMEQFTLKEFIEILDSVLEKKSAIYKALKLMCEVYALSIMDKCGGEFGDILRGSKAQAISKQFEESCMEMKKHSISLVDAFEIPDFLLDAPIGLSRGDYVDNVLYYARVKSPHNTEAFKLLAKL